MTWWALETTKYNYIRGMKATLLRHFPGIAVSVLIAVVAKDLAGYIPSMGSVLIALLLGLVAGNTLMNGATCATGLKFVEKRVLEWAIILSGLGLEIHRLQDMGSPIFFVIIGSIAAIIAVSTLLGKFFKTPLRFGYLLGAGSAICGSSAIAATSPIVEATEEETGLSLAVVNALGLLGMVLLPFLGQWLSMNDQQLGTLLGLTLPALGNVVGAGHAVSPEVGELATVVKLGRIAFMMPLLLAIFLIKRNGVKSAKFPWFILGFVVAFALAQGHLLPENVISWGTAAGKWLLVVAMAAVGAKIKLGPLVKLSKRGLFHGLALFVFQVVLGLILVFTIV